jgi:hypothetical protein
MQMDKARRLRAAWEKKGNPPCDHPNLDKEYMAGYDTGDKICTTCGKCFTPSEAEQYYKKNQKSK